ncbi:uncharacterized protein LOC102807024 [Saccoglossus kowalevskii]|uniref:Uncharacterized protein LOC102807024 n=1 Tax=Saccoglossus kowalevskii TaxID=10224 RepID=A0ABM0MB60_SACKO|nr:PREDICTED: uncharacterized protein LOC102807024 [Saccoglossus kowalevskii]
MQALQFYEQSTEMLATRKFNLRSWSTNDTLLKKTTKIDGRSSDKETVSILGILWNSSSDYLHVKKMKSLDFGKFTTKRDVTSYSASLYDPLGLYSPVHVRAKLLIQALWLNNSDWDQAIDSKFLLQWQGIAADLYQVTKNSEIPRKYFTIQPQNVEIHIFADASERAYGASVYLVSEHESTLVIAKTRVTPIGKQALTLPRLELMGALIGTRLGQFVSESLKDNFNITKRLLWSDNQITLHWLNGRGRQDVFTKNRVLEITSHHQEYRYVPTSQNPADLLTRGISPRQLSDSRIWWFGPDWLTNSALWPKCELFPIEKTDSVNEQFDAAIHHMSTVSKPTLLQTEFGDILSATNMRDTPVNTDNFPRQVGFSIDNIFQVNNYRDLPHLLRITALVLRFVHNIKAKLTRRPLNISSRHGSVPTASEINDAEHRWLKAVQHIHYSDEILYLQRQAKQVGPLCNQLKLFLDDDGILRAGGRLQNTSLPYDSIHPILLPEKHAFTSAVIRDTHRRLQHAGPNATATSIRERYWIISIRRYVNIELNKCVVCKRVDGPAYSKPIPAPLPTFRVQEADPFSVCGIDYTGHLFVKDPISKLVVKTYICLFTCAITRAVHLELVPDLTTTSFIQALRRFSARRSTPKLIVSDNATMFVSAANELKTLMSDPAVQRYLTNHRINWKFTPKRSPWNGGFFERMIAITKTSLKKILGRACVTYIEMETIVTEIESAINDHPLTHLSNDDNDLNSLTPSHLVNGRNICCLPRQIVINPNSNFATDHQSANRRYAYLTI